MPVLQFLTGISTAHIHDISMFGISSTSIAIIDSASGTDVISSITVDVPISDSAIGSETLAIEVSFTVVDSATGTDDLLVAVAFFITDSATGTETLSIQSEVPVGDSAIGTETLIISVSFTVSDTGAGTDVVTVIPDTGGLLIRRIVSLISLAGFGFETSILRRP